MVSELQLWRVFGETGAHDREERRDGDGAVLGDNGVLALESGLDSAPLQVGAGSEGEGPGGGVPGEELFVAATFGKVTRTEIPVGRLVHEEREVGLFAHERLVDEAFFDDDLCHRQGEGCIGPGVDRDVVVRVDRGRGEVGGDDDDLRAVVARFVDEVDVGNAGVVRVTRPDDEDF